MEVRNWILVSAIFFLLLLNFACDDSNIVDPRFYSDDQVVELTDLNSEGDNFSCDSIHTGHSLPTEYSVGAIWFDKARKQLQVELYLPVSSDTRLAIVGSAGEVVKIFLNGPTGAGFWRFDWCCVDEDGKSVSSGIYGVSVRAGDPVFKKTRWFKI